MNLFTHFQKLAENNMKYSIYLPEARMDDQSKDIHDLKKTVHDLTRKWRP